MGRKWRRWRRWRWRRVFTRHWHLCGYGGRARGYGVGGDGDSRNTCHQYVIKSVSSPSATVLCTYTARSRNRLSDDIITASFFLQFFFFYIYNYYLFSFFISFLYNDVRVIILYIYNISINYTDKLYTYIYIYILVENLFSLFLFVYLPLIYIMHNTHEKK